MALRCSIDSAYMEMTMNFLTTGNLLSTLRDEMANVERLLGYLERGITRKEGQENDWLTSLPTHLQAQIRVMVFEMVDMERWPLRVALSGRREVGMYALLLEMHRLTFIVVKLETELSNILIDPGSSTAEQISFVQGLALQTKGHLRCAWSAVKSMNRGETRTIPAAPTERDSSGIPSDC